MSKKPQHKRRFAPRLCRLLGTLVLLAVLAVCLPLSVPRLLGYELYDIVSASMAPAIPVHSVVYVQPAEASEVQEGEVIAYQSDGAVVVHRVTANHVVEGELITKGDANEQDDPLPVSYDNFLGTVAFSIPFIGIYAGALATTAGKIYAFGFLVAAALLFLLAQELDDRNTEEPPKKSE